MRIVSFRDRFGNEVEREIFSEVIADNEWSSVFDVGRKWWSQSKPGTYGVGLLNTGSDPARTERLGILGEMAFSRLFGGSPDTSYQDKGDGGKDLLYNGYSVNIKVAVRQKEYGIIYAQSDRGRKIPLSSDIYVFGVVQEYIYHKRPTSLPVMKSFENGLMNGFARVDFLGWVWKDEINIRAKYLSDDHRSNHMNFHVPYCNTHSMSELVTILIPKKKTA